MFSLHGGLWMFFLPLKRVILCPRSVFESVDVVFILKSLVVNRAECWGVDVVETFASVIHVAVVSGDVAVELKFCHGDVERVFQHLFAVVYQHVVDDAFVQSDLFKPHHVDSL